MSARGIAIAVVAAGVIAGGVALAIAVNADVPDPEAKAHDNVEAPTEPAAKLPENPVAKPAVTPVAKPAPPVQPPAESGGEKHPIPTGGFAAWTGREGLRPGEIEEIARISGMRVPLAVAHRRATLLEERTSDPNVLGELLGRPPTAFMLATIGTQAKVMRDAAAQAQRATRDGTLSDDDAIRATRAAEDTYRAMYQRVTGLSDAQFDQFFSPERPLP
jgi:hypothetical protein